MFDQLFHYHRNLRWWTAYECQASEVIVLAHELLERTLLRLRTESPALNNAVAGSER
jgi:hypothetical protein